MNIYVGNLPYNITVESLQSMFKEFGEIENAKIIADHRSGRSKGFGFIEMPSNSEADQAIKALNNKFLEGMNIKVRPADPGGKKSKKKSLRRRR
jgi:RNA recognition motif-containing protein